MGTEQNGVASQTCSFLHRDALGREQLRLGAPTGDAGSSSRGVVKALERLQGCFDPRGRSCVALLQDSGSHALQTLTYQWLSHYTGAPPRSHYAPSCGLCNHCRMRYILVAEACGTATCTALKLTLRQASTVMPVGLSPLRRSLSSLEELTVCGLTLRGSFTQ